MNFIVRTKVYVEYTRKYLNQKLREFMFCPRSTLIPVEIAGILIKIGRAHV